MAVTKTIRTEFGWVEIGGEMYENDVVIHVDGTVTKREKKRSKEFRDEYGHTPLSHKELAILEDEDPDVVIIGTGQYGDLPITPKAKKILDDYRTEVLPTPQAVERVMVEKGKFMAIIHVTC